MYEMNKDGIEKKIMASRFSENEEMNKSIRDSLIAITKELCDYTHEVNQRLVETARKEEDHNRINDIYTALLPVGDDAEYEAAGLYKMAETVSQRIFLDCGYDEIRSIAGDLEKEKKIYKGHYIEDGRTVSFDYSLEFDRSFIKVQERMFDYAQQYNIKNPMIFSPYSHKSFLLKYDDGLKKNGTELDFCFGDNHIPVVEGNSCLYWNVRQTLENGKTYDAKEPYGDITKYIYTFGKTKKGNDPLPFPVNNQTRIYEIRFVDRGVEVVTNHDIEDFLVFEYVALDLNARTVKECQSKNLLFDNEVVTGTQKKHRIVSEGDIERAIGCFGVWQDICCERSEGKGTCIIRYAKKYCADRRGKNLFHTIRREYVRIKKKNRRFLEDYANYILAYLEYYYPEIEWAGEI